MTQAGNIKMLFLPLILGQNKLECLSLTNLIRLDYSDRSNNGLTKILDKTEKLTKDKHSSLYRNDIWNKKHLDLIKRYTQSIFHLNPAQQKLVP